MLINIHRTKAQFKLHAISLHLGRWMVFNCAKKTHTMHLNKFLQAAICI